MGEDDLPDHVRRELHDFNVELMDVAVTSSTYTCTVYDSRGDDRECRVHFEVRNTALQRNADVLGGVDWDKAEYFAKIR